MQVLLLKENNIAIGLVEKFHESDKWHIMSYMQRYLVEKTSQQTKAVE